MHGTSGTRNAEASNVPLSDTEAHPELIAANGD
jgi:hypothetical protein